MDGETIALVIAAVIGSTGVAAAIGSFTQLSLRNRLQSNIQKSIDLLNSLPGSSKSRKALEAAIEHDTVMLSVLSLRRPDSAWTGLRLLTDILVPLLMILVGAIAALWILYSTRTIPTEAAPRVEFWGLVLALGGLALGYIPGVAYMWAALQRMRREVAVEEILHREGITASDLGLLEERTFWGVRKSK